MAANSSQIPLKGLFSLIMQGNWDVKIFQKSQESGEKSPSFPLFFEDEDAVLTISRKKSAIIPLLLCQIAV
ncbi:MAG: hypothetical protein ACYS0I_01075 [Planctomycetota bacterium]